MFNFQHSQITQKQFEQLADLLVKYPQVFSISKFDVGKVNSPSHLTLKPDSFQKTTSNLSPNSLVR